MHRKHLHAGLTGLGLEKLVDTGNLSVEQIVKLLLGVHERHDVAASACLELAQQREGERPPPLAAHSPRKSPRHTHTLQPVPRGPALLHTMSALLCSQWVASLFALSGHTWQGTNLGDSRDELLHRLVAQKVVRQLHQRPLQACHLLPPDALPKLHPRDPESANHTRPVTRAELRGQFRIRVGVVKDSTFFPRTKVSSPDPVSVRTTRAQ